MSVFETPRLAATTLAMFHQGITWDQILALTKGERKKWWRGVVMDAEDRGFLRWFPKRRGDAGKWYLTAMGREFIAAHAVGDA